MPEQPVRGTPQERERFWEVKQHYDIAREDLDARIPDWDKKDELFRSHINEAGWPYASQVFDPRIFTVIFEKSSRLLASKPKGRMLPREGGDAVGAKINSELLSFQWDEAEKVDDNPMLAKWSMMDMNTRKYGASFAKVTWKFDQRSDEEGEKKTIFDGPSLTPWNNRDVLHNPSYSSIRKWIQLREYVSFDDLLAENEASRKKPVYKNLDILRDAISKDGKKGGEQRSSNWASRNLSMKGLQDFLGRDPVFKTVELITEYRPDRWITFSFKHGVVIRDIPNPYDHGKIPVIMLKYYPVDEDIYGLSEIEPVEKIQRAVNALICQYLDAINMSLYPIAKVRTNAVQMHTLEFGPGKKWLMNDPSSDVLPYEMSTAGISEFTATYRFLIGAMQEALGEASASISSLVPGESKKTATEINDSSVQRNVRDNFNQMFLSETMRDQMMLWHSMNQQFLFRSGEKTKILRIVGRDSIGFFQKQGLDGMSLDEDTVETLGSEEMDDVIGDLDLNSLSSPMYPVETEGGIEPKFSLDPGGENGSLVLTPEDLNGNYDYIVDIRSMEARDNENLRNTQQMIELLKDPNTVGLLQQEGYQVKVKEVIQDYLELLGAKDAEKYFEKIQNEPSLDPNQTGAGALGAGGPDVGNIQQPGMEGVNAPMA